MATLSELQERLALYRKAEEAILTGGQEYRIGLRAFRLRRADLQEIRAEIARLEHRIAAAQAGGRLTHAVTVFGGRR